MRSFAERNAELKNGKWLDGWKEYCKGAEKWYKGVLFGAYTSTIPWKGNSSLHIIWIVKHTRVFYTRFIPRENKRMQSQNLANFLSRLNISN